MAAVVVDTNVVAEVNVGAAAIRDRIRVRETANNQFFMGDVECVPNVPVQTEQAARDRSMFCISPKPLALRLVKRSVEYRRLTRRS